MLDTIDESVPDRRAGSIARIVSVGAALPERVVTSADLEARLGGPPGWIEERTGVRTRRQAANGELAYHLGTAAARRALERAGTSPDDLDAIVFSTMFCDYASPGGGTLVQRELGGRRPVPAFDVRSQSAGFLYALSLAEALVKSGRGRRILVIAAERQHELFLDYELTAPVFGDGAGAVVVGPSEEEGRGILAIDLGADGRGAEMAIVSWRIDVFAPEEHPELRRALAEAAVKPPRGSKLHYWNGPELCQVAVATMTRSVHAVLARIGCSLDEVDWFLFHQATRSINGAVIDRLGVDPARCPENLERYGNTASASLPLLLAELEAGGRLLPGQLVLLSAFGAGYAWGAAAVRW
jgi:3-oxoacyl-[acyl-carrier-protein] synthase-3